MAITPRKPAVSPIFPQRGMLPAGFLIFHLGMGWKTENKSNWEKKNPTSKRATPAAHPRKKLVGKSSYGKIRCSRYPNHLWKGNLGGKNSLLGMSFIPLISYNPSTNSPQLQFTEFPFFKGIWAERITVKT